MDFLYFKAMKKISLQKVKENMNLQIKGTDYFPERN